MEFTSSVVSINEMQIRLIALARRSYCIDLVLIDHKIKAYKFWVNSFAPPIGQFLFHDNIRVSTWISQTLRIVAPMYKTRLREGCRRVFRSEIHAGQAFRKIWVWCRSWSPR